MYESPEQKKEARITPSWEGLNTQELQSGLTDVVNEALDSLAFEPLSNLMTRNEVEKYLKGAIEASDYPRPVIITVESDDPAARRVTLVTDDPEANRAMTITIHPPLIERE